MKIVVADADNHFATVFLLFDVDDFHARGTQFASDFLQLLIHFVQRAQVHQVNGFAHEQVHFGQCRDVVPDRFLESLQAVA